MHTGHIWWSSGFFSKFTEVDQKLEYFLGGGPGGGGLSGREVEKKKVDFIAFEVFIVRPFKTSKAE